MVQDLNGTLSIARTIAFGIATLFAFLVLCLGAAITNYTTTSFFGGYFSFAALGIATAVLTLLTLPVMLFLSIQRKGAITSMIAIEIGWTWFLWILWLSVGGSSAGTVWLGNCSICRKRRGYVRETQALTAFGFLAWIVLFAYNITLIVFVIRQHMRGNSSVWTGYVNETDFAAAGPTPPSLNLLRAISLPNMLPRHRVSRLPCAACHSPAAADNESLSQVNSFSGQGFLPIPSIPGNTTQPQFL
ncbi:hypothetical protein BDZ97DRAFT_687837 [Flammula alnicola]|nr:hypothetical protein BDZ97DRAFT_687837 [Flammula alnicola]